MANITHQKLYTTRQKPFTRRWFAKRLMAAAEIILADQAQAAQVFNEALREACAELDQKKATGAQPLKAIVNLDIGKISVRYFGAPESYSAGASAAHLMRARRLDRQQ